MKNHGIGARKCVVLCLLNVCELLKKHAFEIASSFAPFERRTFFSEPILCNYFAASLIFWLQFCNIDLAVSPKLSVRVRKRERATRKFNTEFIDEIDLIKVLRFDFIEFTNELMGSRRSEKGSEGNSFKGNGRRLEARARQIFFINKRDSIDEM